MKFSTILAGALIALGANAQQAAAKNEKTVVTVFQTITRYQPTYVTVTVAKTLTEHAVTKVTVTNTITAKRTVTKSVCSTTTTATASVGYQNKVKARAAVAEPLYAMEFN